jgi:hypothetical protein
VKLVDAVFRAPPAGPVSEKLVTGAKGVAEPEVPDAALAPNAFVATTEQVYAVPFVRPVTESGLADPVAVILPGVHVAVYPVITEPPVLPGAVNATETDPLPAVAAPMVGAAGGVL